MKTLKLVRVSEYQGATLGVLCINGKPELLTLEDAWRDNERQVSCIPEGVYKISKVVSPKFGVTYTVDNVPERSEIRFHWGNTADDTNGCILLGLKYSQYNGMPAVAQSQIAFKRFMNLLSNDKEGELIIISAYGTGRRH